MIRLAAALAILPLSACSTTTDVRPLEFGYEGEMEVTSYLYYGRDGDPKAAQQAMKRAQDYCASRSQALVILRTFGRADLSRTWGSVRFACKEIGVAQEALKPGRAN